jgi:hypothetical protein
VLHLMSLQAEFLFILLYLDEVLMKHTACPPKTKIA